MSETKVDMLIILSETTWIIKMKKALLIASLVSIYAGTALALPKVGFDRFNIHSNHRAVPISAAIWSPVGKATYSSLVGDSAIFEGEKVYLGAALPDEKMPLIVISHGSGSSIDGTAWLASGLAERGALVLVMNHPGTTTGDSSPRRTVRLSERAADLSVALDHVLSDPYFVERIDTNRISAVGFSLGGTTVLGISGLRLDPEAYSSYCETSGNQAQDCLFLARGGVDLGRLPPEFSTGMSDSRFRKIVAIDPGFTYAANYESAKMIDAPVLLLTLGDDFPWFAVDVRTEGSGLVDILPHVEHVVVPKAYHYSFLPICKEGAAKLLIEEGEDQICDDPVGSNRAEAHTQSINEIARFLKL